MSTPLFPARLLPRALLGALALAAVPPQDRECVGPLEYRERGVVFEGELVPWRRVAVLEQRPASAAELAADLERRLDAAGSSLRKRVEVAGWCRSVGLGDEARAVLEAILAEDPGYAPALRASGRARVAGAWVDARAVLRERWPDPRDPSALPHDERLELAAFCREHGLADEEWALLASVLVEDGFHIEACARMRERVERRPATAFGAPVVGRWHAVVDRTRHHQGRAWALFALDLVRVDEDGDATNGSRERNEDWLSFGAPVHAVADGTVVEVTADTPDQPPGTSGTFGSSNTVSLRHDGDEYSDYFHLQENSIVVAVGDPVRRGQLLGRVGNSGASGAPHLHFEITIPLHGPDAQSSEWLGVPYRWENFRLVEVDGQATDVQVRAARPQEGWTMELPELDVEED